MQFKVGLKIELIQHIKMKHAVDKTFMYPNSTIEAECKEWFFFKDQKLKMRLYTEHLYKFDCEHSHKHIPDDGYIEIHMKMC